MITHLAAFPKSNVVLSKAMLCEEMQKIHLKVTSSTGVIETAKATYKHTQR